MTNKLQALAKYLEVDTLDILDKDIFIDGSNEWLVLTDAEANAATRAQILDSVWAFRPEFLEAHVVEGVDADTIRSIQDNGKCEGNNPILLRLIEDVEHFIEDAIKADGRGHFLSPYDGEELELSNNLFAYRLT